jgi:hypothetical protein
VCANDWCRLLCSLTLVVYVVILDVFDAFVLFMHAYLTSAHVLLCLLLLLFTLAYLNCALQEWRAPRGEQRPWRNNRHLKWHDFRPSLSVC